MFLPLALSCWPRRAECDQRSGKIEFYSDVVETEPEHQPPIDVIGDHVVKTFE
jgi:hypothetical protein